jgi:RecA/RadA recombinase
MQFLKDNPEGGVVYYDTEAAVTKEMMESRGIDTRRVIIAEPDTIQKFRHHALKVIETYEHTSADKRPPMMMVLDSLGLLSTTKEMEDTTEGKETRDMTKAQVIKATFRVLTLKLAKAKIPMLVTNHVYDVVGSYVPMKEIGGGTGLKYAASTIAMLTKKKEKDGTDIIGNIVKVKMYKSRLSKENKTVEVRLSYEKGLDRYYGLLDLAEQHGIIKKVSTRYEMPDGTKVFGKAINSDPEKYFTPEIMEQLEAAARKEFMYGGDEEEPVSDNRQDDISEPDSQ